MRFQYKYEHITCSDCFDLQSEPRCPHALCPHIIDNIDDLTRDAAFRKAVLKADACSTFQRPTLFHLRGATPCPE